MRCVGVGAVSQMALELTPPTQRTGRTDRRETVLYPGAAGRRALVVGHDPWRLAEYAAELAANGVEAHVTRRTAGLRDLIASARPAFIMFDRIRPLEDLLHLYLVARNIDGYQDVPILLVGDRLPDHPPAACLPADLDPAEAVSAGLRAAGLDPWVATPRLLPVEPPADERGADRLVPKHGTSWGPRPPPPGVGAGR